MASSDKMVTFREFEQELREMLRHLHDPDYQPTESFCALLDCDPRGGVAAVQSGIYQAVAGLTPPPGTAATAHPKRVYDVLHHRYLLGLTQEETAYRLFTSRSSVQRIQREAIHELARALWGHRAASQPPHGGAQATDTPASQERRRDTLAQDWRSQVKRELASLEECAVDVVSDVADTLNGVLQLVSTMASERDVHVEVGYVQGNLIAAVHRSVLRQILITMLGQMIKHTSSGTITIFAGLEDGSAKVTLISSIAAESLPSVSAFTRDILTPESVSVGVQIDGDHVVLSVQLPPAARHTVLVVDDNRDVAEFYRRCTEGTSYYIVHAPGGQRALELIEESSPDVIVLDIMLPDTDGWELLMRLRQDPTTRSTPIVVCSVIREDELALSLGASRFLSKPVQPSDFIQALDQILLQAPSADPRLRANNATAC